MNDLSDTVMDLAKCLGACAAGIVTQETLKGGPPSTNLSYVLPDAKSAVTFAVAFDQDLIDPYLMKKNHGACEKNMFHCNSLSSGISMEIATYLKMAGYPSMAVNANSFYRKDTPLKGLDMHPDISHRYLAVRSGIGHFGLSGNVISKEYGAGILLGSVVTTAELKPTEPLLEEDNYCDSCGLCQALCLSGMIDKNEKTTVSLGGAEFSYSKRRDYNRCNLVCGGFTGLHPSGKWSTWSPGRFDVPEDDKGFLKTLLKTMPLGTERPDYEGGSYHPYVKGKLHMTCTLCQMVCTPDKIKRKQRYEMMTQSGVTVQNPDGTLEAFAPDEAVEKLTAMAPEYKRLYQDD